MYDGQRDIQVEMLWQYYMHDKINAVLVLQSALSDAAIRSM